MSTDGGKKSRRRSNLSTASLQSPTSPKSPGLLKSPRSPSPGSHNCPWSTLERTKSPRAPTESLTSLEEFIGIVRTGAQEHVQDDGFHIRQLIVNMSNFDSSTKTGSNTRRRSFRKAAPRRRTPEDEGPDDLRLQLTFDTEPALKLVSCMRRVLDMVSARKKSDKLQELILDWLTPITQQKTVEPLNQTAFVQNRSEFWNCYRADTKRWEGKGSMNAFSSASAPKTPILRVASSAAEKIFPEEPLWRRSMKASPVGSAGGLVMRPQDTKDEGFDGTCRPTTAPDKYCSEEREARDRKLLAAHVGKTVVLPRQQRPAIVSQLPGYFEMTGQRRIDHRENAGSLIDRPFTSPSDSSTGKKPSTSSCSLCQERAFDHIFRDPPAEARRIDIGKNRLCKPVPGGEVAELARQRQENRLRLTKCKLKPLELRSASAFAENMHPYGRKQLENQSAPLPKCKSMPAIALSTTDCCLFPQHAVLGGQPAYKPAKNHYQDKSPAEVVKSDRWRYMRECDRLQIIPRMPPFLLGHASCEGSSDSSEPFNLSISGQGMKDRELEALMEPIQSLRSHEIAMDLSHNMFSDAAVATFLDNFPSRAVVSINLQCSGAGMTSLATLIENMHTKWPRLRIMQLAGCSISESSWETLCVACTTATSPTRLDFVDMRLGRASQQSVRHVASIVSQAQSLEYMDLSGNFIFYEGFEALADALKMTKALRVLDISHNAATQGTTPTWTRHYEKIHGVPLPPHVKPSLGGGFFEELPTFHPAALLAEALSENTSLKELRLASSFLDFSVDCCLLLAVQTNRTLESLDLTDNPHGKDGLRALLRLIVTPGLKLEFCNIREVRPGCLGPGVAEIEFGAPSTGPYNLNLAHPQNRAVIRWLLHNAETSGGMRDPQAAFVDIPGKRPGERMWSGSHGTAVEPGDSWCWRNARRKWELPKSGTLKFNFILDNDLNKMRNALLALKKWQRIRRVPVTLSRFVYVLNMFNSLVSSDEKTMFVTAMGDTLLPKTCHIKKMVQACPEIGNETIRTLYAHAADADPLMLFDTYKWTQGIRPDLRREACACFFWNGRVPTSRYTLDLGNPMDRAVTERMFVVNYFDAMASKELQGEPDTSQHGNWEGVRNFLWEGTRQTSLIMYTMPHYGSVSFDYVSPPHYCPKRDDDVVPDTYILQLRHALEGSPCSVEDKVLSLRSVAHNLILNEKQVHEMCASFPNPNVTRRILGLSREQQLSMEASNTALKYDVEGPLISAFFCHMLNPRIEVFVLLFTRCIDPPALCTYECLWDTALFSRDDSKEIVHRLGRIRTMDALNCCRPYGLAPEAERQRDQWHPATVSMSKDKACTSRFAAASLRGTGTGSLIGFEVGRSYSLQLDTWEDWIVAGFLLIVNDKEGGFGIVKSDWTGHAHLAARGVDFMVPTDWYHEGRHPHQGTFTLTFISESDDHIKHNVRRLMAEKYFAWERWESPLSE